MSRILDSLRAKYRAFAPLACFHSPRPDVVGGIMRWRWLVANRRNNRLVDPSVEVRLMNATLQGIHERLQLEEQCSIDRGCIFWMGETNGKPGMIRIGRRAYVGPYSFLGSCHNLEIGDNAMIGAGSYLITVNHETGNRNIPYAEQGYAGDSIRIGENAWLGCHVTVLPGLEIGAGAIIGAGAVVTKPVPAGETWAGIPARKLS